MKVWRRPAEPDKRCSCGRPAVMVFLAPGVGPVAWCGDPEPAPCPGPWDSATPSFGVGHWADAGTAGVEPGGEVA